MIARLEPLKPGPAPGFLSAGQNRQYAGARRAGFYAAPLIKMPFLAPQVAWGGPLDSGAVSVPESGSNPIAAIVPATHKTIFQFPVSACLVQGKMQDYLTELSNAELFSCCGVGKGLI